MNAQGHFFDLSAWTAYDLHRQGWTQSMPHLKGRAKSMSGWTAELLGRPDEEWLAS